MWCGSLMTKIVVPWIIESGQLPAPTIHGGLLDSSVSRCGVRGCGSCQVLVLLSSSFLRLIVGCLTLWAWPVPILGRLLRFCYDVQQPFGIGVVIHFFHMRFSTVHSCAPGMAPWVTFWWKGLLVTWPLLVCWNILSIVIERYQVTEIKEIRCQWRILFLLVPSNILQLSLGIPSCSQARWV